MTGPCNKHISIKYTENLDKLQVVTYDMYISIPFSEQNQDHKSEIQGLCTGCPVNVFSTPLREGICSTLFTRICSYMYLNNSSSQLPSLLQKFRDQNATVEEPLFIYICVLCGIIRKKTSSIVKCHLPLFLICRINKDVPTLPPTHTQQ